MAAFWHAFFTLSVGFTAALFIFYKMKYTLETHGVDAKMVYGFKMALFGVLIGTIDYMGGNATKGNMASVLQSMGFLEHTSVDTSESEQVTLTTADSSTSPSTTTTTTISADDVTSTLDYKKLLDMQDKWFNFFAIQRGVQLLAPYFFMFAIEAAIGGILTLAIIYI